MMTAVPSFTAEQLGFLADALPSGVYHRVLGGLTATTDAQQVGAYALLTTELR
jgi:hypothetical protein